MNRFSRLLRRFRRDTRGVSALEFALLLPVMLLLVAGTVDVSEGLTVHRKLRQITSIVVDLVAQSSKLSSSEVNTILAGAARILDPYPSANLSIVVSVVDVKNKNKQWIEWSVGYQGKALEAGSKIDVPDDIASKNSQLVRAEVRYSFRTIFTTYLSGMVGGSGYTMTDVMYQRPRISDEIDLTS
jgi:Flp pilus assembly protein TadG